MAEQPAGTPGGQPAAPGASAGGEADGSAAAPPADVRDLPELVRDRLAGLVSAAVGEMAAADIPASLRPVARFAPAKRAKVGGAALVEALASGSFRAAVLRWCEQHRPRALDTAAPDLADAASAAVLLDSAAARHYLELARRRAEESQLRGERDAARAEAGKLRDRLADAEREASGTMGEAAREADELRAEADRLGGRLREQGVRLRRAKDEATSATAAMEQVRADADLELKALTAERDRDRERAESARVRAQRAEANVEIARQAAREARAADEVRLALLLETLDGTVTGLRRELAIGGGSAGAGARPADLVHGADAARAEPPRVTDTAALDRLLALPAVHLIVDGYNVTKTGYPDLPLSEQRNRLAHQLAALSARTSAEVTLVFDGADVVGGAPPSPRGVRVLFSESGVLADDVIRTLVSAEPGGRPLVVASTDREVADSVRRRGAHPVPSAVLLSRLDRI